MKLTIPALLSLLICCLIPVAAADSYTLYLVRHAEKAETNHSDRDPPLSACGQARAAWLAQYFADIPLARIYSSAYQRTEQTVAPLASARHITISTYNARDLPALAAQLHTAGQNALVAGHSNTTPQLAALLSAEPAEPMTEQEYGRIYKIVLHEGAATLQVLQQAFDCGN